MLKSNKSQTKTVTMKSEHISENSLVKQMYIAALPHIVPIWSLAISKVLVICPGFSPAS